MRELLPVSRPRYVKMRSLTPYGFATSTGENPLKGNSRSHDRDTLHRMKVEHVRFIAIDDEVRIACDGRGQNGSVLGIGRSRKCQFTDQLELTD